MGTCYLFMKRRLKKPLVIFAVIILIFTVGISCTTTSDEVIEGTDDEAVIEEQEEEPEQEENDEDIDLMETTIIIEQWEPMRLIIPAIDVDVVCVGGGDVFDEELLNQGPTHFQMSDLPSTEKGNVAFAVMWHFISDIDNLVEGDEIYLDVGGYRFIYEVVWEEVIDKHDWEAIETTDYPSITIQTSHPGEDDYRLMVRGQLKRVVKTQNNIN